MMKYRFSQWIPAFPEHYKGKPWSVRFGRSEINACWMDDGRKVENWDPSIKAVSSDGPDVSLDFMFGDNAWPLFSTRLKELLESVCPNAIQFLPFTFAPRDNSYVNKDFFLGQVLHLIDALDRKRTKVDNDDWTPRANGTFRTQYPLHLLYSVVAEYPIFRVAGSPSQLFIRGDVQSEIEKCGFTGSRFDPNNPICTFEKG